MKKYLFVMLFVLLASFGASSAVAAGWAVPGAAGNPVGDFGLSSKSIGEIITNAVGWMLYILGFVAILAFLISGFQYFMAGANDKMAEKAKETMTYGIIGVVVALSGLVIITAINAVLVADTSIDI